MSNMDDTSAAAAEAMNEIKVTLMDLYDQAVVDADDPREIDMSRETAKEEAQKLATTIVASARVARILSYEMWRQRNGGPPAEWYALMLAAEVESDRVAALLGEGDKDKAAEAANLPRLS
jgi:hypothetical protein